jgi:hypothetical protein
MRVYFYLCISAIVSVFPTVVLSILPLREAFAHFARQNTISTVTETGSSDNRDAHTSIDISTNFGGGYSHSLRARRSLSSAEFWLLCRGEWRKVPTTMLETSLKIFLLLLAFS